MNLTEILEAYRAGELDQDAAETAITGRFFQDLGHSTVDTDRSRRTGNHEVIYGEYKTPEQIADLVEAMQEGQNVLVTRTDETAFNRSLAAGDQIFDAIEEKGEFLPIRRPGDL